MSLDVPVLDLYHGGVLALVERPAINSIFLARRIVLDDRRPNASAPALIIIIVILKQFL